MTSPSTSSPLLLTETPALNESDQSKQLEVGGPSVQLDHLGPLIINLDGTVARIHNWDQLSEAERNVAKRRVAKRNKERLDVLAMAQKEAADSGSVDIDSAVKH